MAVELLLVLAVASAAALYAAVGHGGASAYLAVLALAGRMAPEVAATVLVMNLLVAGGALWRFRRAGHLDPKLAGAFVLFSAPAAFAGGLMVVTSELFRVLVGVALLAAAVRFALPDPAPRPPRRPRGWRLWLVAAPLGTGLGLLAGLTGVGGGIFLSPVLLLVGWKDPRGTAAVAAAFILVNSTTGLAARLLRGEGLEPALLPLVAAALVGGAVGAWWGATRASWRRLMVLLAAVLAIAGLKLVLG